MLTSWTKQFLVATGLFVMVIAGQVAHITIKNMHTFDSAPRTVTAIETHSSSIN